MLGVKSNFRGDKSYVGVKSYLGVKAYVGGQVIFFGVMPYV